MHRLSFEAFGLHGRVEVADPEVMARVPTYLPPAWRAADLRMRPDATFRLAADGALTLNGQPMSDTAGYPLDPAATLGNLIRWWVAENAPDHVFVHAGVVNVGGVTILLPGNSRCGKTTLVRALLDRGATYLSDEYAPLDFSGRVHPYPKPLSIRTDVRLKDSMPVDEGQIGRAASRPAAVVLTWFESGASWNPRRATTGEGAFGLVGHVIPFRRRPAQAMAVLSTVARSATILVGPRGEAAETAGLLIAALAGESTYPRAAGRLTA